MVCVFVVVVVVVHLSASLSLAGCRAETVCCDGVARTQRQREGEAEARVVAHCDLRLTFDPAQPVRCSRGVTLDQHDATNATAQPFTPSATMRMCQGGSGSGGRERPRPRGFAMGGGTCALKHWGPTTCPTELGAESKVNATDASKWGLEDRPFRERSADFG